VDAEFVGLVEAIESGDGQSIKEAAGELDRVLRVAAAGSPNTTEGLLLGLLEETRMVRRLMEIGVSRVEGGFIVRICSDLDMATINFDLGSGSCGGAIGRCGQPG
jgi:hypothetical protein